MTDFGSDGESQYTQTHTPHLSGYIVDARQSTRAYARGRSLSVARGGEPKRKREKHDTSNHIVNARLERARGGHHRDYSTSAAVSTSSTNSPTPSRSEHNQPPQPLPVSGSPRRDTSVLVPPTTTGTLSPVVFPRTSPGRTRFYNCCVDVIVTIRPS
jgi:hypothetical protein